MMCQNCEKQLQRLQKEYMSVSEKDEQLGDKVKDLEVVAIFFVCNCYFRVGLVSFLLNDTLNG